MAKRRPRRQYGARDVGPAAWNGVNIDRIQRLVERAIVECQRTDKKGTACECHDADPVTVQLPCHVIDRQFGARQSVRYYIGSQHTSRRINREDHLITAAADVLPVISEQRTSERRAKTKYGAQEQASLKEPARRIARAPHTAARRNDAMCR